jgi:2-polyprenyl-3-methyl-5-hydroxy-6-metoxy-1,4-benzoquinol methylase
MLIDEIDPQRIQILYNKLVQNADKIKRLAVEFSTDVDLTEFVMEDLDSPHWPLAVDPLLIANDALPDRIARGELISTMLLPPLNGLKFLDFGCGDGTTAFVVSRTAQMSVGYDIVNTGWDQLERKPNLILTQNRDDLLAQAPFDVILAYDVFDHMKSEDEVLEAMSFLSKIIKHGGQIKIRFHPWSSRHATHCYRVLNKAFVHLVLTKEQLVARGCPYMDQLKITEPILTYHRWIKSAGLSVINSSMVKEPVEDFFKQPHIAYVLKRNWKDSNLPYLSSGQQLPVYQMEMQFLDFTAIQPTGTM